jgi:hypothetical protein
MAENRQMPDSSDRMGVVAAEAAKRRTEPYPAATRSNQTRNLLRLARSVI